MNTIIISGVNFILSEETANEYVQICKEREACNRAMDACLEERDWSDLEDCYQWACDLDERLLNLGGH